MKNKAERAAKRQRAHDHIENLKAERTELDHKLNMCFDEIANNQAQLKLNADPEYHLAIIGADFQEISWYVTRTASPDRGTARACEITDAERTTIDEALLNYGEARKALESFKVTDSHGDEYPVWIDIHKINRYVDKLFVTTLEEEIPF